MLTLSTENYPSNKNNVERFAADVSAVFLPFDVNAIMRSTVNHLKKGIRCISCCMLFKSVILCMKRNIANICIEVHVFRIHIALNCECEYYSCI